MNGQYKEEFHFTELEFLTPFEFGKDDLEQNGWKPIIEGSNGTEQVQNCDQELTNNRQTEREESEISQLFAIGRHQLNRCLKCNKEEEHESVVLACALQYPGRAREGGEGRGGFVELVRASLSARRSTPAWCEACSRFTPTAQRGRLARLPPILAINCGGVTAHEKAYWSKCIPKEVEAAKKGGSGKPCRYGIHCARHGCRFRHPDRPTTMQTGSKSSQETNCVLPHQLLIRLQADGDVVINDKNDISNDFNRLEVNKHKKKMNTQCEDEYSLSAAVVCVEDHPKNLVAYIQVVRDNEPQWYLFNDLSVVPVGADEVVQFSAWWKSPCVLFYTSNRARNFHKEFGQNS